MGAELRGVRTEWDSVGRFGETEERIRNLVAENPERESEWNREAGRQARLFFGNCAVGCSSRRAKSVMDDRTREIAFTIAQRAIEELAEGSICGFAGRIGFLLPVFNLACDSKFRALRIFAGLGSDGARNGGHK